MLEIEVQKCNTRTIVIYAGDKSTNLALSFLFSSARDYFSHCRFYALSESRFLFQDFSPALYNMQVLLISRCDSWHVLHPLHNPHRFLINCDATGADAELPYVFRVSRLLTSLSVPHFLRLSSSLSCLAPPRGKLTVRVLRLDIEASQETPKNSPSHSDELWRWREACYSSKFEPSFRGNSECFFFLEHR